MLTPFVCKAAGKLFAGLFCCAALTIPAQNTCVVNITSGQITNPQASRLLGMSFDGRSSMDFNAGPGVDAIGYYDPSTGAVMPAVQPLWDRVPMGGVRYPGNLVTLNWNWSYTIGPFADRTAQPMSPGGANSQKLQFGFDEFMEMAQAKGLSPGEVQIMVNIYGSIGQPNPATLAADWVAYCNAPNNGSVIRNNIDWANLRATYGHPEPYNIKIWNIGNEPWTGSEFGSTTAGANNYMAVAGPIIDSMKAVDPTIQVTIPAVGNGSSAWNVQIMNPSAPTPLLGKIYGLSPHAFYDTDGATPNPLPSQALTSLSNLAAVAATKNLKIVAGDHANFAPAGDPDEAMRWEGALATGDFLLGVSQINNIELANFWIYGNTQATWHPIRKNGNGTFTLMAAAQLYESLFPYFYDEVLSSSIVNSVGGASVPNTRVSTFRSADQSQASVIIINTSLANDNEIIPPALSGFALQAAKLLTASSVNQDTFITSTVLPLGNGHYQSPKISILILEYAATVLSVEYTEPIRAFPVKSGIQVEWATATESNCDRFEVERSSNGINFAKISTIQATGNAATYHLYKTTDANPMNGLNYYRIKQVDADEKSSYSKVIAATHHAIEILVYPNPASESVCFETTMPIERVAILNLVGHHIKTIESPRAGIPIADLPQGVYYLQFLDSDNRIVVKKVIKQ